MSFRSAFLVQIFGALINTAAFIALTPVLIFHLGSERYGLFLLVLGFVVVSGVAEFGLSSAATRQVAAEDESSHSAIFGVALTLSFFFAVLGGVLLALLSTDTVSSLLIAEEAPKTELRKSCVSLFLLGFFVIFSSVPRGVLHGISKFVSLNVIGVLQTVLSIGAPALYAYFVGNDLQSLLALTAAVYAFTGAIALILCMSSGVVPVVRNWAYISRSLLSYGWWATISASFHRLSLSLDRTFLGSIIGPSAVAFYVIPQSALERSQIVSSALMSVALPKLARAPHDEGLVTLCYQVIFLMAPIFVGGIIFLFPIFEIWLGSDFASRSHSVAVLLAMAVWLDLLARVPYITMQAKSLLDKETKVSGIIAFLNLVFLAAAINAFGLEGAALLAILRSAAYLVLRLRVVGLPSGVTSKIILNSSAVGLATCGGILYVAANMPFFATSLWLLATLLVAYSIQGLYPDMMKYLHDAHVSSTS